MDYGNTKTPSMHARLGNASLSQLAFPEESDPNFPRNPNGTIQLLKKKKKVGQDDSKDSGVGSSC